MHFTYDLPAERIAQRPCQPADAAKLLIVNRVKSNLLDSTFTQLTDFLRPDDLLIFNDSRVIPARLFGHKANTPVEILLLQQVEEGIWLAIGKPLKRLKIGTIITFANNLSAHVAAKPGPDRIHLKFYLGNEPATTNDILAQGLMPIPPYIRSGISDQQDLTDYQTVFAKNDGSIAAPTASLHFTESLFRSIKNLGCSIDFLTLHVGLSSIKEVEADKPPESENFFVSDELKQKIKLAKQASQRVIAVGTTAVRALESSFNPDFSERDHTSLYIQPGYEFKAIDAMITNFHFPNSTHLQLVQAFMGSGQLISAAYKHALEFDYRFLSYGDGMLIV